MIQRLVLKLGYAYILYVIPAPQTAESVRPQLVSEGSRQASSNSYTTSYGIVRYHTIIAASRWFRAQVIKSNLKSWFRTA